MSLEIGNGRRPLAEPPLLTEEFEEGQRRLRFIEDRAARDHRMRLVAWALGIGAVLLILLVL